MGGLQKHGDGGTFLTVMDGSLVQSHKEPIPGRTVTRVNKNGKTVHEEKFDVIEGMLVSLKTKDHETYGKQYVIGIKDGEDMFYINVSQNSGSAVRFLKALPNVDLEKVVKFMPWSMADKTNPTKKVQGITMWQDGEKILPFYTKEAPNGLPEMKKVKLKGKDTWDSYEMDVFLEEMALKMFEKAPAKEETKTESPF
jgi:hypothetical protein